MIGWALTPEIVGLSALAAADGAAFLSGLNPSFFTMRAFRSDKDPVTAAQTRTDIRIGSAIGGTLALGVGIGASLIVESWWPAVATAIVLAVIIGAYEYALSHPHNRTGSIAKQ